MWKHIKSNWQLIIIIVVIVIVASVSYTHLRNLPDHGWKYQGLYAEKSSWPLNFTHCSLSVTVVTEQNKKSIHFYVIIRSLSK